MKIKIDHTAKALGVDKALVVLCQSVSTHYESSAALEPLIGEVEQSIKAGDLAPSIFEASFRAMFEKMGYPGTIPAGAKLRNRIARDGFKRISALVDAYNLVAARYAYGIGAHDASYMSQHESAELTITLAAQAETIIPLFSQKKHIIPQGDLIYSFNGTTVAWLGKRDTDADEFKITENSEAVFFVLIGREDISAMMLKTVGDEIIGNLGLCYPLLQYEHIFA